MKIKITFKKDKKHSAFDVNIISINLNGKRIGSIQKKDRGFTDEWFYYLGDEEIPRINTAGEYKTLDQVKTDIKNYVKKHLNNNE